MILIIPVVSHSIEMGSSFSAAMETHPKGESFVWEESERGDICVGRIRKGRQLCGTKQKGATFVWESERGDSCVGRIRKRRQLCGTNQKGETVVWDNSNTKLILRMYHKQGTRIIVCNITFYNISFISRRWTTSECLGYAKCQSITNIRYTKSGKYTLTMALLGLLKIYLYDVIFRQVLGMM